MPSSRLPTGRRRVHRLPRQLAYLMIRVEKRRLLWAPKPTMAFVRPLPSFSLCGERLTLNYSGTRRPDRGARGEPRISMGEKVQARDLIRKGPKLNVPSPTREYQRTERTALGS